VAGVQIDPEMLGLIFEGLMDTGQRADTGTFYTPPAMVDSLTARAIAEHVAHSAGGTVKDIEQLITSSDVGSLAYPDHHRVSLAFREVRILDPACGSGAFLLGALSCVARARVALGEQSVAVRRDIVARCLHGVDLLDDAALICSLRLWLALADSGPAEPAPLPNLDRRIRQGDALLDPLELLAPSAPGADAAVQATRDRNVRRSLAQLQPLADSYVDAEPDARHELRESIASCERSLAVAWIDAMSHRIDLALRETHAASLNRDLWGAADDHARIAGRRIAALRKRQNEVASLKARIQVSRSLPFFSFRVHFPERARFDVIISNPPWVRAHRWPALLGGAVRDRYEVCRKAGWPDAVRYGSRSSGQVDLAALFVERAHHLLEAGGVAGLLLPAKVLRSLYAGGARALVTRDAHVCSIDDYSLDHRAIFRADAFTVSLVTRRKDDTAVDPAADAAPVRVRMFNRSCEPLEFELAPDDLPLVANDFSAPWLIAPPEVLDVFRRMQRRGTPIARQNGLSIGRGAVTGANDVLIVRDCEHKLGGLSLIRAEGFYRARRMAGSTASSRRFSALIETDALRPLLRGSDVRAWSSAPASRVIWVPSRGRRPVHPRLDRYLARHAAALEARTGTAVNARPGSLMRISDATLGHKVVWRDIAQTLCAAAVPDSIRGDNGCRVPVIPLNTTYFVGTPDRDAALLLAAYMNALPLRVFARAAAERAKDAHFRFFAWTVGVLPLPRGWRERWTDVIGRVAGEAHDAGGLTPAQQSRLDAIVARAFDLTDADMHTMLAFDRWLSGQA
jgi:hypothetical protein